MKRNLIFLCFIALLAVGANVAADNHEGSWTGEVMDMACYIAQGGQGTDHAGCANACLKGGQPMGLLTDDGTLVLLAADHKNGEPYEMLKGLGGYKATVTGELSEKGGMKLVTVTGAKAAG